MKSYVLLETGAVITNCSLSVSTNLVGEINLSNGVFQVNGRSIGITKDINCNFTKKLLETPKFGKVINDCLPVEFHLHDLKTTF